MNLNLINCSLELHIFNSSVYRCCSEVHICVRPGLDFHEDLHRIGAKEGLKGRKLQKAMESYAWNITVLKVSWMEARLVAFSPPLLPGPVEINVVELRKLAGLIVFVSNL